MNIRAVRPEDRARIEAMFGRCSPASLQHRFHAPVTGPPARYLDWVLGPRPRHVALVARRADDVVGIAEAHRGDDDMTEVALLVEDTWQRQGVGAELFRAILGCQRRLGTGTVRVTVQTERSWLVRRLARLDRATVSAAGTTCEIVIPLAPVRRQRWSEDVRSRYRERRVALARTAV